MQTMMNTMRLHLHFRITNFVNPTTKLAQTIPIITKSTPINTRSTPVNNPSSSSNVVNLKSRKKIASERSRIVVLGAASFGVALFLMGLDEHKAMALGPEGPLMEEFWDNMRRYALYALTVSTGAISILLEPIFELLKNPISAVLIIAIIGGGIFIVSQVVTAMVGLSDFSYDYSY